MREAGRRAVLRSPGTLVLEAAPARDSAGGGIEVEVSACGVCRTDVHIVSGADAVELPRVLGHEVCGRVAGLGAVVLYGSFGCGACAECRVGAEQLCPDVRFLGRTADGGFADRVIVPALRYCVPIGDLDPVDAAPLADAGLTAYRAVTRVRPWLRPGGAVVVIGAGGGLGRFAVQLLRELTGSVIAVAEVDDVRRARALLLAADRAVVWTDDVPVDAVIDLVGSRSTLDLAADAVRTGGVIVVVGDEHDNDGLRVRLGSEVTVVHSIWGSLRELEELVAIARSGRLELDGEAVALDDLGVALARLDSGVFDARLVVVP